MEALGSHPVSLMAGITSQEPKRVMTMYNRWNDPIIDPFASPTFHPRLRATFYAWSVASVNSLIMDWTMFSANMVWIASTVVYTMFLASA